MVKKIFITFIYLFIFGISFIFFLPKENLYYFLENKLMEKKIIIDKETVFNKPFSLIIKNPTIYYDGILISKGGKVNVKPWIIFNEVYMDNLRLSSNITKIMPYFIKKMIPKNIKDLKMNYSIFNPIKIFIEFKSNFGNIRGWFKLTKKIVYLYGKTKLGNLKIYITLDRQKKVILNLKPSKLAKIKYKSLLHNFVKQKDGDYKYEIRF